MNIPFRTPVHLRTPRPREQVIELLRETLRFNFWASILPWSGKPITGRVDNERCKIRYRTWYNNSSQRQLRLSIVAVDGGTALDGEFAIDTPVLIFFGVWLTGVVFFCALFTWSLLTDKAIPGDSRYWTLLPFGLLVFGIGLFSFGLWLSRLTEPKVLEYLRELIGTELVDGGSPNLPTPVTIVKRPSGPGELLIRPRHESPDSHNPRSVNPNSP